MTAVKKLFVIAAFTMVLFVGAFGTSFFALKLAFADEPAAHGEKAPPAGGGADTHDVRAAHHHDPSEHFNFLGSPGEHYGKDVMGGKFGDGVMLGHDGQPILDQHGLPVPEEEMSAPFIFMVLNFVLLLIILAWKGKPVIEKLAADRHDQIKTALDEAAKLRQQAKDKLEEYASKLSKADAEIKAMVDGMRADAEADKKRILEATEKQAAQMKRDAEQRIAAEIQLARTALTREVTQAAVAAAEQLLKDKVTPQDQSQIVGTFITGISGSPGAGGKEAR
jgi:F-type H+-transporting ATPase subunit b